MMEAIDALGLDDPPMLWRLGWPKAIKSTWTNFQEGQGTEDCRQHHGGVAGVAKIVQSLGQPLPPVGLMRRCQRIRFNNIAPGTPSPPDTLHTGHVSCAKSGSPKLASNAARIASRSFTAAAQSAPSDRIAAPTLTRTAPR